MTPEAFHAARLELDLSQRELADALGVASRSRISHWETGRRRIPTQVAAHAGNNGDEYTPFRTHLRRVKRRSKSKGMEFDITLEYLKDLWESQNGICSLTGLTIDLDGTDWRQASLDRIDSSEWYTQGNVQWVSTPINVAKGTMTNEQVTNWINEIKNN